MYRSTGGRQVCFSLDIGSRNLPLHSMSIATSARFMPETMESFRELALPRFASGTLRAAVDVQLPMPDLVEAHAMVDARMHPGTIVLLNPS
jgi:hypothetical protein